MELLNGQEIGEQDEHNKASRAEDDGEDEDTQEETANEI